MSTIKTVDLSNATEARVPFTVAELPTAPEGVLSEALSPQPRRHTFFLLIWIIEGQGDIVIDFKKQSLKPHQLHLIAPGQVQFWNLPNQKDKPLRGYYIYFTEALFMLGGSDRFLTKIYPFDTVENLSTLTFTDEDTAVINQQFLGLFQEYKKTQLGWIEAIIARLQLILIMAQRRQEQLHPQLNLTAGQRITHQFQQLLKEKATEEQELRYYANHLGVTVGHLSETTKEVVGLSAGRLLRQQRLLEAKRMLVHSEKTIAQVADSLNFVDASYFGRFFKRETGNTPKQFRSRYL